MCRIFGQRSMQNWLSRQKIDKLMLACFKLWYPTTSVIIDCLEFFINTSDSLIRQSATFSSYKSHNTVKCLIGNAPHGHVTFVSPVFEGSASDRQIVEESGLLELLPGERRFNHGRQRLQDTGSLCRHWCEGEHTTSSSRRPPDDALRCCYNQKNCGHTYSC